jgi:polyferredoxin
MPTGRIEGDNVAVQEFCYTTMSACYGSRKQECWRRRKISPEEQDFLLLAFFLLFFFICGLAWVEVVSDTIMVVITEYAGED